MNNKLIENFNILNNITSIPTCKYCNNEVYFISNKRGHRYIIDGKYSKICKKCYQIIKTDVAVKCSFLKREYLLDLGLKLTFFNSEENCKKLKKIRTFFGPQKYLTKDEIYSYLLLNTFSEKYAKILSLLFFINIKNFIKALHKAISTKNHHKHYYILRGWSKEESNVKLLKFFQAGSNAVKEKCLIDPEYKKFFNESRKPGALAASKISKNTSKTERLLIHSLNSLNYNIFPNFYTPIDKSYNYISKYYPTSNNFSHDIVIGNYIIEYNGSYWHKDYIKMPQKFKLNDYIKELYKAHYCINYKRKIIIII